MDNVLLNPSSPRPYELELPPAPIFQNKCLLQEVLTNRVRLRPKVCMHSPIIRQYMPTLRNTENTQVGVSGNI